MDLGKIRSKPANMEVNRLESEMSFMQVRSTLTLTERLQQVSAAICFNRKEMAYVRLEGIAGADNAYSFINMFGRCHIVAKVGGRCIHQPL
jgi:hypothetical protein